MESPVLPCIRLWTRENLPESLRFVLDQFDDVDYEVVCFVAHLPAAMADDRLLRQAQVLGDQRGVKPALAWLSSDAKSLIPSLFGANALEVLDHPDGDGSLIVGSSV